MTYNQRIYEALQDKDYTELRTIAKEVAAFDEATAHQLRLEANKLENEELAFDRARDEALIG